MSGRRILVVGGTSGMGLEIVRDAASRGDDVVLTCRSAERARAVADSVGPGVRGVALELSQPDTITEGLAEVGRIDGLVLAAIERDVNTVREYDQQRALRLVTLKLVGYAQVVHALLDRLEPSVDTGIVLFGGRAKDAPYPGSTTVSTINGGVEGLTATLALELAPIRVNAVHPGIIGDSPYWASKPDEVLEGFRSRTPGGKLATMQDVVDSVRFLLTNRGVSGSQLYVDRGWRLT